jgi:glycosyltransferase involved in cell wall biosynthesis
MSPHLSVVVPLYQEAENIPALIAAVTEALCNLSYELILVDDGSTDGTLDAIAQHATPQVVSVELARNFGQSSAMAAGISVARGELIVTMDGDLQNDPQDIPAMRQRLLEDGVDLVLGVRQHRQDGWLLRRLPSLAANGLIRLLTGVQMSDYGCTLKIFRADLAKKMDLYGELHRYIPILASMVGARMVEMPVRHHPRRHGQSKYGLGRIIRVLSDVLLMVFFLKYRQKPMHFFGGIGLACGGFGGLIAFYMLGQKLMGEDIGHRPMFYLGIVLVLMAVQFISVGFLSELMMRTYYESQQKKPYTIRAVRHHG